MRLAVATRVLPGSPLGIAVRCVAILLYPSSSPKNSFVCKVSGTKEYDPQRNPDGHQFSGSRRSEHGASAVEVGLRDVLFCECDLFSVVREEAGTGSSAGVSFLHFAAVRWGHSLLLMLRWQHM